MLGPVAQRPGAGASAKAEAASTAQPPESAAAAKWGRQAERRGVSRRWQRRLVEHLWVLAGAVEEALLASLTRRPALRCAAPPQGDADSAMDHLWAKKRAEIGQ